MVDHFSGFTWAMTCPDKVADRCVAFVVSIFLQAGFGMPDILQSDNGGEFVNKVMEGNINMLYGLIIKYIF